MCLEKTKIFCLKDTVKLHFLGYVFHYEKKWKIKNKIMYTSYLDTAGIALYPDKAKVNNFIKTIKRIFKKSTNLNSYSLIAKINPIISSWASYFNLGNCFYYRNKVKNLIHRMVLKWAHKKHKRWGIKKIVNYYFLNERSDAKGSSQIHSRTRMHKKRKGLTWAFSGLVTVNSCYFRNRKNEKRNYLYNVTKGKTITSALTYNIPVALKKIHFYHFQRLKLMEWIVSVNFKVLGFCFNKKTKLYKKQKSLCFVCHNLIEDQKFYTNEMYTYCVNLISKSGSSSFDKNIALIHSFCHYSINHLEYN